VADRLDDNAWKYGLAAAATLFSGILVFLAVSKPRPDLLGRVLDGFAIGVFMVLSVIAWVNASGKRK
jgi:hypothetical protein